jgi:hypothetical protein
MQMRRMYESTDKKQRAQQRKHAADEAHYAGFPGFRDVDAGEAILLDPNVYEEPAPTEE